MPHMLRLGLLRLGLLRLGLLRLAKLRLVPALAVTSALLRLTWPGRTWVCTWPGRLRSPTPTRRLCRLAKLRLGLLLDLRQRGFRCVATSPRPRRTWLGKT